MSVLDSYRDANGEAIQSYYAAYMILHGFSTPEEARKATCPNASNADYVIWNQTQWADFERLTNRPVNSPFRRTYRDEFKAWLEQRCAEKEAA